MLDRVRPVFLEKGYSAATLDDLAAAAGLNRPSLYAAFGSKEQLYVALIGRVSRGSVEGIDAVMASPGTVEERLNRLYRHAIRQYTSAPRPGGCLIVGTASVEAPTHPAIAEAARGFMTANEEALARHFARAVEDGALAADPAPPARARMATALLDTLAIRARLGEPVPGLEAFARSSVPIICARACI
ncbi:TetR/AcrR family transcriptional regulator [Phreatobacter sp.]|uniref:TetR/AcrR family transcriptional regulator n=1 Tax=Phreatobacter sp. TaxID=1966341 RepID=UPI003F70DB62